MAIESMWQRAKNNAPYISLGLCIAEVIIFLCSAAILTLSENHRFLAFRLAASIWFFGGISSITFAFIGLNRDRHRRVAIVSMIAAVFLFLICGFSFCIV
jgi:hypothetical protein